MQTENFKNELSRCLGCKAKPCEKACPLGVSPHDFIALALKDDFNKASSIIAEKNPLPQTCGLVCPDRFCQKACIRAKIDNSVEIPCLQAEIMRRGGYPDIVLPPKTNKKAAVIGGGPAGLGATYELILAGWCVDLYEKESRLGGTAWLIPDFRLPKEILEYEINRIVNNDRVTVRLNTEITDFQALKKDYDGVILSLGKTITYTSGIKGGEHYIPYTEYLSHPEKYQSSKIAIVGGGEVALDCAMTAKKNGSKDVEMFVRRRREDMRIMARDQLELEKFGIIVRDLSSITEIKDKNGNYDISAVKNRINDQGKAETLAGTDYSLGGYDILVEALGAYYPKEHIPEDFTIAGDMTGSSDTVVQALSSGREAALKLINGENK